MKTIGVTLTPFDALRYMKALEDSDQNVSLQATITHPDACLTFDLWGGYDHGFTQITLRDDGTWSTSTELVITMAEGS